MKRWMAVPGMLLAAPTAGCGAPVHVVASNPRRIEVRWQNSSGDFDRALRVAELDCGERERKVRPRLDRLFMDRDVSLAMLSCR